MRSQPFMLTRSTCFTAFWRTMRLRGRPRSSLVGPPGLKAQVICARLDE
jgi:hypothetical protein